MEFFANFKAFYTRRKLGTFIFLLKMWKEKFYEVHSFLETVL